MFSSVRNRLIVLAGLPLLVIVITFCILVWSKYETTQEMDDLAPLTTLGILIGSVVHETQLERDISTRYLGLNQDQYRSTLHQQRQTTQQKIDDLRKYLETFNSSRYGFEFQQTLLEAITRYQELNSFQSLVDDNTANVDSVLAYYSQNITLWLKLIQLSSELTTHSEISLLRAAYVNFLKGKDAVDIERALMSNVFEKDQFEIGKYGYFRNLLAMQETYFEEFKTLATKEQVKFFEQKMSNENAIEVQRLRYIALARGEPSTKPKFLSALYEGFGYGGIIHHFKNYVLRAEPRYRELFETHLTKVTLALNKLALHHDTTTQELRDIATIRHTLEQYNDQIQKVTAMINDGKNSNEIDNAIKINDAEALEAIHKLAHTALFEGMNVDPNHWIDMMTLKFNLLREVENKIALDLSQLGNKLKEEAIKELTMLVLLTIATISLVLAAALYMAQSITAPLKEVIHFAGRIASNDIEGKLPTDRRDELGDLASALNQMSHNLRKTMTELADNEIELKSAMAKTEAATQAKTDFLASMSHEIRTPMNGVLGMTEILSDSQLSAEQREIVDIINSSGQSLMTIINDILDFTKIEACKLELEPIKFDITQTANDVFKLSHESAKKKNIELSLDIQPSIPRYLVGDAGRIRQVLLNLVNNAIKFTPCGYVKIVITLLSIDYQKAQIKIEVQDNGIGIATETQKKLFKAFTQADASTTRKFGGTGLGLSICKQLIDLMGGDIGINSSVGEGATFWFNLELPLAQPRVSLLARSKPTPIQAKEKTTTTHSDSTSQQPDNRMQLTGDVLLVEDDKVNQMVASTILKKMGLSVTTANNGLEGVALSEQQPFDIILMDCQMPKLDGFGATKLIRSQGNSQNQQTPIIALTANATKEDRPQCLNNGMTDFITKPYTADELRMMVTGWLNVDSIDEPQTPLCAQSKKSPDSAK